MCFTLSSTPQFAPAVSRAQKPQVALVAIVLDNAGTDRVHMGCSLCVHICLLWGSERKEAESKSPQQWLDGAKMNSRSPHGRWQKAKWRSKL